MNVWFAAASTQEGVQKKNPARFPGRGLPLLRRTQLAKTYLSSEVSAPAAP